MESITPASASPALTQETSKNIGIVTINGKQFEVTLFIVDSKGTPMDLTGKKTAEHAREFFELYGQDLHKKGVLSTDSTVPIDLEMPTEPLASENLEETTQKWVNDLDMTIKTVGSLWNKATALSPSLESGARARAPSGRPDPIVVSPEDDDILEDDDRDDTSSDASFRDPSGAPNGVGIQGMLSYHPSRMPLDGTLSPFGRPHSSTGLPDGERGPIFPPFSEEDESDFDEWGWGGTSSPSTALHRDDGLSTIPEEDESDESSSVRSDSRESSRFGDEASSRGSLHEPRSREEELEGQIRRLQGLIASCRTDRTGLEEALAEVQRQLADLRALPPRVEVEAEPTRAQLLEQLEELRGRLAASHAAEGAPPVPISTSTEEDALREQVRALRAVLEARAPESEPSATPPTYNARILTFLAAADIPEADAEPAERPGYDDAIGAFFEDNFCNVFAPQFDIEGVDPERPIAPAPDELNPSRELNVYQFIEAVRSSRFAVELLGKIETGEELNERENRLLDKLKTLQNDWLGYGRARKEELGFIALKYSADSKRKRALSWFITH